MFSYIRIFDDGSAPMTPFGHGGLGMYFIYLSNRNHCTYLFQPRELDGEFWSAVQHNFAMGYSQLFVVEKCFFRAGDGKGPAKTEIFEPPDLPGSAGMIYGVFENPARVDVGSGALRERFRQYKDAKAYAMRQARKLSCDLLVGRILESISWH